MSFPDDRHQDDVMSDINMTPLIDVMLVLLIVFMVTLPVITHAVKIDLPVASSTPNEKKSAHVTVSISAAGALSWDSQPLDQRALRGKLAEAAAQQPQPELELYADRGVHYEAVADTLSAMQRAGLTKIDFVTQPETK
ncbi:TPA: biopolymer transporter ExbD [Burkholderia cenocepacia]|nr:biopolymer transporter ExbD [Burkholderia cenocepacia]HDR9888543.1 biopolymer transporter ExbD [Burkholderia cenocepacia]